MNILFYDTETSNLPLKGEPSTHPDQPHCMQIGAGLFDDEEDRFFNQVSLLLACGRIQVDEKAFAAHKITCRDMAKYGIQPSTGATLFMDMTLKSDMMVGYNVEFDRQIIAFAMYRAGYSAEEVAKFWQTPHYDIMKPLTDVCKIPNKWNNGYKWPKLIEAYEILIDPEGFDGAHDAFADIMATVELWKWCLANDVKPLKV